MGGKAVFNKLGREHMREIGRKGGKARVAQSRAVESSETAEVEQA
jgi:general stress protein YciG